MLRVSLETPGPSTWTEGRQKIRGRILVWTGDVQGKGVEGQKEGDMFEKKNKEEVSPPGRSSLECGSDEGSERPQSSYGGGSASRSCNTHQNILEGHNYV